MRFVRFCGFYGLDPSTILRSLRLKQLPPSRQSLFDLEDDDPWHREAYSGDVFSTL